MTRQFCLNFALVNKFVVFLRFVGVVQMIKTRSVHSGADLHHKSDFKLTGPIWSNIHLMINISNSFLELKTLFLSPGTTFKDHLTLKIGFHAKNVDTKEN